MPARRLTIHVFNNYGQYEGHVSRSDLANAPTPTVRIAGLVRSAVRVAGRGWCVFLGDKARIPRDIKTASH